MALHPEAYLNARKNAPFHVQLELEKPTPRLDVNKEHGRLTIRGRVIRLFRSNGKLKLKDDIKIPLYVSRRITFGPGNIEPDPDANYIEAYLEGNPPHCKLVLYEVAVINAPTDEPCLTVADLERLCDRYSHRNETTVTAEEAGLQWERWFETRASAKKEAIAKNNGTEGRK